jgi:hypothetical protein
MDPEKNGGRRINLTVERLHVVVARDRVCVR